MDRGKWLKNKKYSGWPGDCSQEQLATLDKFRVIVKDNNEGTLMPQWNDAYLLRFLRARKFNLEDTEKMWVDFVAWRRKNSVDTLQYSYHFPELIDLRKHYPHGYHKIDKRYRPVYIERLGFANPEQIFKFTTADRLLTYYMMLYETLLTTIFDGCTEQKRRQTGDGSRVVQTCTILDLTDVSLGNAGAAYKFVKPASAMAQDNYPEILGTMLIINAPMLFTAIWAVVKMWIDDKTKEKIKIIGSGYKEELLKYVDASNLPDFLDGGCLSKNVGPWNPQGKEFFPHCLEQPKKEQSKGMKEEDL